MRFLGTLTRVCGFGRYIVIIVVLKSTMIFGPLYYSAWKVGCGTLGFMIRSAL